MRVLFIKIHTLTSAKKRIFITGVEFHRLEDYKADDAITIQTGYY